MIIGCDYSRRLSLSERDSSLAIIDESADALTSHALKVGLDDVTRPAIVDLYLLSLADILVSHESIFAAIT